MLLSSNVQCCVTSFRVCSAGIGTRIQPHLGLVFQSCSSSTSTQANMQVLNLNSKQTGRWADGRAGERADGRAWMLPPLSSRRQRLSAPGPAPSPPPRGPFSAALRSRSRSRCHCLLQTAPRTGTLRPRACRTPPSPASGRTRSRPSPPSRQRGPAACPRRGLPGQKRMSRCRRPEAGAGTAARPRP